MKLPERVVGASSGTALATRSAREGVGKDSSGEDVATMSPSV